MSCRYRSANMIKTSMNVSKMISVSIIIGMPWFNTLISIKWKHWSICRQLNSLLLAIKVEIDRKSGIYLHFTIHITHKFASFLTLVHKISFTHSQPHKWWHYRQLNASFDIHLLWMKFYFEYLFLWRERCMKHCSAHFFCSYHWNKHFPFPYYFFKTQFPCERTCHHTYSYAKDKFQTNSQRLYQSSIVYMFYTKNLFEYVKESSVLHFLSMCLFFLLVFTPQIDAFNLNR